MALEHQRLRYIHSRNVHDPDNNWPLELAKVKLKYACLMAHVCLNRHYLRYIFALFNQIKCQKLNFENEELNGI